MLEGAVSGLGEAPSEPFAPLTPSDLSSLCSRSERREEDEEEMGGLSSCPPSSSSDRQGGLDDVWGRAMGVIGEKLFREGEDKYMGTVVAAGRCEYKLV